MKKDPIIEQAEKERNEFLNSKTRNRPNKEKSHSETETPPQPDPSLLEPVTLQEVLDAVEAILPGKRDLLLLDLAVSISHFIDNKTPLWLMTVGVPSSAKTEVATLLALNLYVYPLDILTENAFVSGSKNKDGSNPKDLLPLLNGKCFLIKDFTTTLSQREETVRKLLGDLISIYDSSFSKHSPARGTIRYRTFFSILGCVTPQALNRHQRYMNQIGPRFLFFRVAVSSEDEIDEGFEVLWSSDDLKTKFEEVQRKVSAYSYQLAEKLPEIKLNKEEKEVISYLNLLAKFIARARGIVITRLAEFENSEGERITFYEPIEIQIEEPYRALLQLRVLGRSLVVVKGKNNTTFEELELVRKVALSSMPADRSLLLTVIAKEDKSWSANDVAKELGISHKTALRQLDELVSLKILTKQEQGEGLANLYSVVPIFHSVVYPSVEFMSHLKPTETQTPHQGNEPQSTGKPIDQMASEEQLTLAKSIFGKRTRWEDEK